jgi:hypothetical protein
MRTNLKVILAAISIAVLMSPVMAETRAQAGGGPARGTAADGAPSSVADCVHTAFPQCSNWRRAKRIHKAHAMRRSHKNQTQEAGSGANSSDSHDCKSIYSQCGHAWRRSRVHGRHGETHSQKNGSGAHAQAGGRPAEGTGANGAPPSVTDCVHTAFPQCSNYRKTKHIHKARAVHKSHEDHPHPL